MGEVLMHPMGGGIGSDDVTAAKAHVLAGHNTVTTDSDDEVVEGTMPDKGQWQYGKSLVHANGYYAMNQLPEGYYHADGATWAPEIRMEDAVAKQSQMWSDAYSAGVSDADSRVNRNSASYKARGYTTRTFNFSGTPANKNVLTNLGIDVSLPGYLPVSAGIGTFNITKNHVSGDPYENFIDHYSASLSGNSVTVYVQMQWNNDKPTFDGTIVVGYIQS